VSGPGLRTPPADHLLGVDLGEPQGRVNVAALVDAGCDFVIIRATQGLHDIDKEAERTAAACIAELLPFTFYGVLCPYPVPQAEAQARHFLELSKGYPLAIPPALDFELSKGRTAVELFEAGRIWCETVEAELGKPTMVYTSPAFVEQLDKLDGVDGPHPELVRLAERRLWLAHYTGDFARGPRTPVPWSGAPWVWQGSGNHYTKLPSGERVLCSPNYSTLPGGSVEVDVNLFAGDLSELLAPMARPASPAAQRPS